jgi:uncharacterized Fe-S radical SAM superfamily protein PflX
VWYRDVVLHFLEIKYMVQKINVFFGLHTIACLHCNHSDLGKPLSALHINAIEYPMSPIKLVWSDSLLCSL